MELGHLILCHLGESLIFVWQIREPISPGISFRLLHRSVQAAGCPGEQERKGVFDIASCEDVNLGRFVATSA